MYFSAVGLRASKMAGYLGDHLITVARDPDLIRDVIFPNFEAGAKKAGKDPRTMQRAVVVLYFYDPEYLVDPEAMRVSAEEAKIEVAGEGTQVELWHSAEDIIKQIEELKKIGFDHVILGNVTLFPDEGPRLKIFRDVFPHIV